MEISSTNGERVREEMRILRAARDGRLRLNEHGRYVIDGEPRPSRKERERLLRYDWIYRVAGRNCPVEITATGRGALDNLEVSVGA